MSKKNHLFFLLVVLMICVSGVKSFAQDGADARGQLAEAHALYEKGEKKQALARYETLFAGGTWSEKMLVRLSELHEAQQDFPTAIYYLRKSAQEFGGEGVNAKIRQLMQLQGSTRYFSDSGWDGFIRFFNSWGLVIWILFGIAAVSLSAGMIFYKRLPGSLRWGMSFMMWPVFFMALIPLFLRLYMIPERAVIVAPTAFYNEPSWAASWSADKLSPGELVEITSSSDIWVEVRAGNTVCWVPRRTVRLL